MRRQTITKSHLFARQELETPLANDELQIF